MGRSPTLWGLAARAALGLALAATPTPAAAGSSAARASRLAELNGSLEQAASALDSGDTAQARALFDQVRHSAAPGARLSLTQVRALDGLGDVERLEGRLDQAVPLYTEAAAGWTALLGERQPRLATTLHNLGLVQLERGDDREARVQLERALEIWRTTLGADSAQATATTQALALCDDGS